MNPTMINQQELYQKLKADGTKIGITTLRIMINSNDDFPKKPAGKKYKFNYDAVKKWMEEN